MAWVCLLKVVWVLNMALTSWLSGGTGLENRSEVGVGNLIVPIAYDVSPDLNIAGSVDFVWAGMDLQMLMAVQLME